MKNQKGITLIHLLFIILAIAIFIGLFFSSTNKTERLAEETQEMILKAWEKNGIYVTVLEDMVLTKTQDNEYSGTMKIKCEGKTIQITGTVIYDGKSIQWMPDTQSLMYQLLF